MSKYMYHAFSRGELIEALTKRDMKIDIMEATLREASVVLTNVINRGEIRDNQIASDVINVRNRINRR